MKPVVQPVPLTYSIIPAERLVHVQAEGVVTLQDILDYLDEIAVSDAMPYGKLFDTSGAQFTLSDSDMMVLGARVSAYAEMEPRGPVALVVSDDVHSDLARRFANLGGARRPAKVFRAVEQARAWLNDGGDSAA
jgi:hypothetical protein